MSLEINFSSSVSLRDSVADALRKAIFTDKLHPGQRLVEVRLSQELGVSRTPVREAIHMLTLDGLVTVVPGRGAFVSHIDKDRLKDVLEVRKDLDLFAAELACERIDAQGLEKLKKACSDFDDLIGTHDVSLIAERDVSFHRAILYASKNSELISISERMALQIYRYRVEYLKDTLSHARLADEHRVMYDNIKSGNRLKVRAVVSSHIANQESAILAKLFPESSTDCPKTGILSEN